MESTIVLTGSFEQIQRLQTLIEHDDRLPPKDNTEAFTTMLNCLKGLRGIEVWIGDIKMKEHFQRTVYPAIEIAEELIEKVTEI